VCVCFRYLVRPPTVNIVAPCKRVCAGAGWLALCLAFRDAFVACCSTGHHHVFRPSCSTQTVGGGGYPWRAATNDDGVSSFYRFCACMHASQHAAANKCTVRDRVMARALMELGWKRTTPKNKKISWSIHPSPGHVSLLVFLLHW
jgi:hypothetical protein